MTAPPDPLSADALPLAGSPPGAPPPGTPPPGVNEPGFITPEAERDLGFGAVVSRQSRRRLLNRDGSFNVAREGLGIFRTLNPYHWALARSWTAFLGILVAFFLAVNTLFATGYWLCGPRALALPPTGMPGNRFLTDFFFSVETFGTIGYGHVYPVSIAANTLMSVEALVGLLAVALTTGIIFARFSRPRAHVRFSDRAVIASYRDGTAFEFRIANEQSNELIELEAKVLLSRFENGASGIPTRRFYDLPLERRRVVFFPLAWTIVHPIGPGSPLYGLTQDDLVATSAEFLVLLTGIDEAFSQVVHTRTSYAAGEVVWEARFANVFNPPRVDGVLSIDIGRIDQLEVRS